MMEKQEDQTEEIQRKRTRQSSSSVPPDLITEIFLKLPLKSVSRFRCVSKLWSSIAADPYFTNTIESRSLKKPNLLLCFRRGEKLFVFSIPQDHDRNSNDPQSISSQPVDSYEIKYPKYCFFSAQESVHGLISFRKASKAVIWNPTTRQFLTLPKPEKRWKDISIFLGYDPIGGKHKVVCMSAIEISDESRVLTLGQESWRSVKTSQKHHPSYDLSYECIDGVVYYEAKIEDDVAVIMSFNVRSENFNMIKVPWKDIGGVLAAYEGKLASIQFDWTVFATTRLWILEDAEKHEWSSLHFSAAYTYYDRSLETDFCLIGMTDAGEFVYVPKWFHTSFYIVYYDTKRNSYKRVEHKGIADKEFRLKNGLGNSRLPSSQFYTFANHIESLKSL